MSKEERIAASKNPWKTIRTKYLLEIEKVHEVYKSIELIGYYVEIIDYIKSSIIQDGAWIKMFLDTDQYILRASHPSFSYREQAILL